MSPPNAADPVQADAWHTAMKHSRQAMEALAGGGGECGNMEDWESPSVASSEGGALAAGAGEKPTLEVWASLGEFAIFVSGRVCDDWWPTNGETVCFWVHMHRRQQKYNSTCLSCISGCSRVCCRACAYSSLGPAAHV